MGVLTTSSSSRTSVYERRRLAYGRVLCRAHAAPLLTMASILLNDVDAAADIVSATLAAACRPVRLPHPSSNGVRVDLARSVYRRCTERPAEAVGGAAKAPGSELTDAGGLWSLDGISAPKRAVLCLTLFGGHDLRQTAETLQMTVRQTLQLLRTPEPG